MNAHETWLDPATVVIDTGREAVCRVGITNTGDARDQFYVEVLGTATSWLVREPPTVSLEPGQTGSVDLTFRPARNHAAGSRVPFAVHVLSKTRGLETSVVQQGMLQVKDPAAAITAPGPRPRERVAEHREVPAQPVSDSQEVTPPAPDRTLQRRRLLGRRTVAAVALVALVGVAGGVIASSSSLRQVPLNLLAEGERRAAAENTPGQVAAGSPEQSASPIPAATPTLPTQGLTAPSPAPA
ncbi:MAG: hypothetical protein J2P45_16570, partial [Candidatus Dormibacteraeota bacterium]|nr:hypothetical protein [Candidatus Dormibacteraeota bacterium]